MFPSHDRYGKYATTVREKIIADAEEKARKEEMEYLSMLFNRKGYHKHLLQTRSQVKHTVLKSKFKQLQERLKL